MFSILGFITGITGVIKSIFNYQSVKTATISVDRNVDKVVETVKIVQPTVNQAIKTAGEISDSASKVATAVSDTVKSESQVIVSENAAIAPNSRYWLVSNVRPILSLVFAGVIIAHLLGFLEFTASQDVIDKFFLIAMGYLGVHSTTRGIEKIIGAVVDRKK